MTESKRKRLQYKTAVFLKDLGDPSCTLEKLINLACKKVRKAKERMYAPQQDKQRHFLNYHADHASEDKGMRIHGCEFLAYEEGASQSTLSTLGDDEELDLDALPAQKGKEFLEGSVYFAVCHNHVVIMGSRALRSKELESYLNWFLIQKAKVLPSESMFRLDDHIPMAKKKKLAAKGVKGMSVSAPIKWHPATDVPESTGGVKVEKSTTTKSSITPYGRGWEAVKAIFGEVVMPGGMSLQNLADTPDLEVSLSLRWVGKAEEDGAEFLDGIASNLRHVDDELDYHVETKTGSFGKDEFKHYTHLSTDWLKGRPKFDKLFPKMASWLEQLIADGIIDP